MENYSKRNLRNRFRSRYWVKISDGAFEMAVQGLSTFDSKPIFADASSEKTIEAASKLVFERFKNCAYETSLYKKAYELRWALVEIVELHRETDPDTKWWLNRLWWERQYASVFMNEFLERWEDILDSSGGIGIMTPQCAEKLSFFKDIKNCASSPPTIRDDACCFLNDVRDNLISSFGPLLTVTHSDVAEVASKLTDVPSTLILLPSRDIDYQMQKAINMTYKRVVDQQQVIREIYETLASPRRSRTRPRGSFLLLGQSGAGKTEIAKAVAEHWYCDVTRLVEIDMSSECADESVLWRRLAEAVAKRPYSVFVLDKIDKASPSVKRVLVEVLSNEAPSSDVDLSNSIIFMTSCVESDVEVKKHVSADVLDSLDKVLVVKMFRNYRAVCRLLLREIVRQVTGQKLVVHASDDVLNLLVKTDADRFLQEGGRALKRLLLEHVIPWLQAGQGFDNVIVFVDVPEHGSSQVSLSFQRLERSVDDWYFKQQDGTFDKSIANFRTKVESVCRMYKWRSEYVPWLDLEWSDSDSYGPPLLGKVLEKLLVDTCNEILAWSPCDVLRERTRFVEDEREKKKQKVELQQPRTMNGLVDAFLLFMVCLLFIAYVKLRMPTILRLCVAARAYYLSPM